MQLYRVAARGSAARHVLVTFVQLVLFWSTFLWLLPELVARQARRLDLPRWEATWLTPVGSTAFLLMSCLGLASAWVMSTRGRGTPLPLATARDLVVAGPYRFVRNPMALAGIGQGVAVGLWRGEPAVVVYALLGALVWHFVARPGEERDLQARFGDRYARYQREVPLWRPRWRPYRPE
jgi:protein-S-isoprenylcysteine O-methyltransferase Ste14